MGINGFYIFGFGGKLIYLKKTSLRQDLHNREFLNNLFRTLKNRSPSQPAVFLLEGQKVLYRREADVVLVLLVETNFSSAESLLFLEFALECFEDVLGKVSGKYCLNKLPFIGSIVEELIVGRQIGNTAFESIVSKVKRKYELDQY